MQRLAVLMILMALALPVHAGLYNPCELDEGPFSDNFFESKSSKGYRETLLKVRSLSLDGVKVDNPFRQRYLLVGDALAANSSKLTLHQKIALSEYEIRRRRPLDAKFLLAALARQPGDNFLLLSNLATACQQVAETKQGAERASEYQQAIDNLTDALARWPKSWEALSDSQRQFLQAMYWTEENFVRCRNAEDYFLRLLRSRRREAASSKTPEDVDPLFVANDQGVLYVSESGEFEPGKLAEAERAKLPEKSIDRALQVTQQLLVWLPLDTRLYWQLGELYAARGKPQDLRAARKIFDELVWDMNVPYAETKKRRAVLNQLDIPEDTSRQLDFNDLQNKLNPAKDAEKDDAVTAFAWRTLAVGFGAGLLFALFAQWQLREVHRRRQTLS